MKFLMYLILFAILVGIGNLINTQIGGLIAGIGFSLAYFFGEGNA